MKYNDLVLRLFFNPSHAGVSKQNAGHKVGRFIDARQQQQIHFYLGYQSSEKICSIRYLVKGNPYMVAGAEWMAEEVEKNKNAAILKNMTPQYWQDLFAIPVLEKQTAVSLSQAATVLYEMTMRELT